VIDGGLRGLFRENLKIGWSWTTIETGGTGRGVPDSHFCCRGVSGWLEYKTQKSLGCVALRPEQIAWLSRYSRCGGRAMVAVRHQHDGGVRKGAATDTLWLLRGDNPVAVRERGLILDAPWVLGRWKGGPSAGWRWDVIGELLLA
jgi:hypothetical protein